MLKNTRNLSGYRASSETMGRSYVWSKGLYGCQWRYTPEKENQKTSLWELLWSILLLATTIFTLIWTISWIATQNNWDYISEFIFKFLGYFSWWVLLLVLSVTSFTYVTFLLVLFLIHIGTLKPLYMHWFHKVLIFLILIGCVIATFVFEISWSDIWQLTRLFVNHYWIVIHPILAILLVPVGYVVARALLEGGRKVTASLGLVVYIVVVICNYASPLFLKSPCQIDPNNLPPKPGLIAHRGGSALGPENTLFAFRQSAKYDIFGFEGDVSISYDGVPFLFHDDNLRRVTNVEDVFPEKTNLHPSKFHIAQLQSLNAGSWYLQHDQFGVTSGLNEDEKFRISNQTIPRLKEALHIVKESNKSFLFDIKFLYIDDHPYSDDATQIFVDLVHEVGINPRKVVWVYDKHSVNNAEDFITGARHLLTVDQMKEKNIELLNAGFFQTDFKLFRKYQENNISINIYVINSPWLFSTYWCAGINTTTTNNIKDLFELDYPVLLVSPTIHITLWVLFDAATAITIILIFVYTSYHKSRNQDASLQVEEEFVWSVSDTDINLKAKLGRSGSGHTNATYTVTEEIHI